MVTMTRTDAFLFAIKKAVEAQRGYIDGCEVKSLQVTVVLSSEGKAKVDLTPRTESLVSGCFDGNGRMEKYAF